MVHVVLLLKSIPMLLLCRYFPAGMSLQFQVPFLEARLMRTRVLDLIELGALQ